jgi:hypothetical protein
VEAGVTLCDPFAPTDPMPWSMLTVSAFEDVQVSVEELPAAMACGSAEMLTVGSPFTVTTTLLVAVPPEPFTVIVYVVVTAGLTIVDPFTSTVPIPLSILAVSAPVDVQESVVD